MARVTAERPTLSSVSSKAGVFKYMTNLMRWPLCRCVLAFSRLTLWWQRPGIAVCKTRVVFSLDPDVR